MSELTQKQQLTCCYAQSTHHLHIIIRCEDQNENQRRCLKLQLLVLLKITVKVTLKCKHDWAKKLVEQERTIAFHLGVSVREFGGNL